FMSFLLFSFFFFQAEDGIRDLTVTGVQTCALPILVPFTPSAPAEIASAPAVIETGFFACNFASPRAEKPASLLSINRSGPFATRSEERRVGKECRCRWSP